jgi:hypothetical protein
MFSVDDWLQRECIHFHGYVVMDDPDCSASRQGFASLT